MLIFKALAIVAGLFAVPSASDPEVDALSRTIYAEANGEGREGMVAVANVVLNRLEANGYGRTIRQVVRQRGQFNVWDRGKTPKKSAESTRIAQVIIMQRRLGVRVDPTNGATHFHNRHVKPAWARRNRATARIGGHYFYRV